MVAKIFIAIVAAIILSSCATMKKQTVSDEEIQQTEDMIFGFGVKAPY